MFIETYYDERALVPCSMSEPVILYPELSGEELTAWRDYLPIRRPVANFASWFNGEAIPGRVITEIERAQKGPLPFDRVEIWCRTDDPMAVGVIDGEKPRYFSIARWGDAKLTLRQMKRQLWIEKFLLVLTATRGIGLFTVILAAIAYQG